MFRRGISILAFLALVGRHAAATDSAGIAPTKNQTAAPAQGTSFTLAQPAIAMIWVASGTFFMSSTHSAGDDTLVTLTRGYWLGRTEVTQGQWQAVMDGYPLPSLFRGSERPVEKVGWDLAMSFCAKLNEREGAAGRLPPGYVYTLPTEAQWEYACRAGTTGSYAGDVTAMAWYDANSGGESHPVAQKAPNAWGFYDMHGNVAEWCANWYGGYPGGTASDPEGVATKQFRQFRVHRGGAYPWPAGHARSAFRAWIQPVPFPQVGFRLALAPLPASPATGEAR
jgi:formylglycine-generating enzyme required for sulfatase activity